MKGNVKALQKALASVSLYSGKIDGDYGKNTRRGVAELQRVLKGFTFYRGRIDGDYGRMTTTAVVRFQRLHPPLVPDGIVGAHTMALMFPTEYKDRGELDAVHTTKRSPATGKKYPHESQCAKFYGKVGKNQVKILLPYKVRIAWAPQHKLKKIVCHKKVAEDLQGIYEDTLTHYGYEQIVEHGLDLWGGTLNVRKIRGGSRWSTHAWGIAEDINPVRNQLHWHKPRAQLSGDLFKPYWGIVEEHGATSLGKVEDYDWMHKQFCHR